jgi:hypothetical protein
MAKQDMLMLECRVQDTDVLVAEPERSDGEPRYYIATEGAEEARTRSVYLDVDQARELFNHLGVWLHTRHQQEI